jgi:indolepyruvate ferredoxin oxidoreductase beta subunit
VKYDIILCGVGGQGGIFVSVVIAKAAMAAGLSVKQSEVHGMSQRGGEVLAHLRLSDAPIASPLIPLSFEPLEGLRYLPWLAKESGVLVSAIAPVRNMPAYPELDGLLAEIRALPRAVLVDAEATARAAGNLRAANMALVGAAARFMPVGPGAIEQAIADSFARKGEAVVAANLKAFRDGQRANS